MTETTAFFDASCACCGARYGWCGTADDSPTHCQHCGYDLSTQREQHRKDIAA